MLLRASGETNGTTVELSAITRGAEGSAAGIAQGDLLVRFAEAVLGEDAQELVAARGALLAALEPEAFVDAVAVVANFQRMVRIADGTGIPLDAELELLTGDLREALGIARFGSAANTRTRGWLRRRVGRALLPVALAALRRLGRRRRA